MMPRYATFAALAGVDPTDHLANESGLPPIDSLNVWPFLSGQEASSPRQTILINENALIHDDYKVVMCSHQRRTNSSRF